MYCVCHPNKYPILQQARYMRPLDRRLYDAIEGGDLAATQAAVADGASMRAQHNGEEPLHLASWKGHLDIAQWLRSEGASLNAINSDGDTPLHLACFKGHLDVAQLLHSAGASIDAADSNGETPLNRACYMGHLGVAQWLYSVGASVNATDNDGLTPLHFACWQGHLEIAQWLCSAGADATLKTNGGDTPVQLLQRPDRTAQLDQQALRSTLACLVRRAQAQGPLPCTVSLGEALPLTPLRLAQMQRLRLLRQRPPPHPA